MSWIFWLRPFRLAGVFQLASRLFECFPPRGLPSVSSGAAVGSAGSLLASPVGLLARLFRFASRLFASFFRLSGFF